MKIETKYTSGDIVYFLSQNKILCSSIGDIRVYVDRTGTDISYTVLIRGTERYKEDRLFSTKENLIKELVNE